MAVAALSPWPSATATVARTAARAALKAETGASDTTDDELDRVGAAASTVIERYAPSAPDSVRGEAMVRLCGYILNSARRQSVTGEKIGDLSMEYSINHAAMFRHSGAQALLSPWKVRRAGAIG